MNLQSKSIPFRSLNSFLPAGLLLLILSIAMPRCFGQEKFFLKIDDIKGGSTSASHKDQIDVISWSWGLTPAGTIGSKPVLGALTFEMVASVASPVLMLKSASGAHLSKAVLVGYKHDKGELRQYMTITLQDIKVSSFSTKGTDANAMQAIGRISTDGGEQIETVSLTFSKIDYAFGSTKTGYDFAANKPLVASPGGTVKLASIDQPSTVGSDSLKVLLHADTSSPLQLTTETRDGKQYLAVEVARSKDSQTSQLVAQVSKDLETWSAGTVIEEVAQDEPTQQIIRYLIPIDQAQQFLRVSTQ
jgi:type VI secretion system Hcp family effector